MRTGKCYYRNIPLTSHGIVGKVNGAGIMCVCVLFYNLLFCKVLYQFRTADCYIPGTCIVFFAGTGVYTACLAIRYMYKRAS